LLITSFFFYVVEHLLCISSVSEAVYLPAILLKISFSF